MISFTHTLLADGTETRAVVMKAQKPRCYARRNACMTCGKPCIKLYCCVDCRLERRAKNARNKYAKNLQDLKDFKDLKDLVATKELNDLKDLIATKELVATTEAECPKVPPDNWKIIHNN